MCCIAHSGPNSSAKRFTLLVAASRIEYTYNHNQCSRESQFDAVTLNNNKQHRIENFLTRN